jgi:electron transfer flavoprotein alpha subunit
MDRALVFADRDALVPELVTGARNLGYPSISLVLFGPDAEARAARAYPFGAARVYAVASPSIADLDTEVLARAVAEVGAAAGAETYFLASTRRGKELAGRLAQRLGAGCVTDAIGVNVIDGHIVTRRYSLGGGAIATERVDVPVQVVAVMPRTFEAIPVAGSTGELIHLPAVSSPRVRVVERRAKSSEGVDLESAERVVGVGKGLRAKEDLALLEPLVRALHAEIGCTRGLATERGWLSEERLIGLSGKRCKPRLYVGLGVSGQIQHMVGVAGARVIVAVNTDKDAPIFAMADYGIVGDLYEVVPRLIRLLA